MAAQLDRLLAVGVDGRVDHRERLRDLHHFRGRDSATVVAIVVVVISELRQARQARNARSAEQDRYYIDVLRDVVDILGGRVVTDPNLVAYQARQRREEARLPALVRQLPEEWTALLRLADGEAVADVWDLDVAPWLGFRGWDGRSKPPVEVIIADLSATIRHLRTGEVRSIGVRRSGGG